MASGVLPRGLRIVAADDDTVLDLEPMQGLWTEQQYLKLTDESRRFIEFSDGSIEVLPMPTDAHQAISQFLLLALLAYVQPFGGKVQYAPLRIQIRPGTFREPDLMLLRDRHDPRRQQRFWLGADLVVEIVSPDDPERDTVVKRADYAEAGIPEYWMIHPTEQTITVLQLTDDGYTEAGVYHRGATAISMLLAGFAVSVDAVLDAQ